MNTRWIRVRRLVALILPGLLAAGVLAGCGKKGPPLAPLVRTPLRVRDLNARRLGDTVRVGFTIPDANADGTQPADLSSIDVYAYTAMKAADVDDLKRATLVASVPVQRPVTVEQEEKWKKAGVPPPPNPGKAQGSRVSVSETMTPDLLVPLEPDKLKGRRLPVPLVPVGPVVTPPLTGPVPEPSPSRFYVAYGVSRKGRKGPLSPRPGVPMVPPPAAPGTVSATVSEAAVTLTWTPPAAERLPIQEPASGDVLPATPKGVPTSVVYLFNVYAVDAPIVLAAEPGVPAGSAPAAPAPLNPILLDALTFADADFAFGIERCYAVRAVAPTGPPRVRPAAAAVVPTLGTAPVPATGAAVVPPGTAPAPATGAAVVPPGTAPVPVTGAAVVPPGTAPVPATGAAVVPPGTAPVPTTGAAVAPPGTASVPATGAAVVPAVTQAPAKALPAAPPIKTPSVPGSGASSVESDPSAPLCVTPVDVFPPPVPASLGAVASEGAVSLIWDSVDVPDLAGYIVLRAETPEGPFTPLFDVAIRETTYRDGTAKPGVRYLYVVVSADTATPRNVSSPSNRVEESAR